MLHLFEESLKEEKKTSSFFPLKYMHSDCVLDEMFILLVFSDVARCLPYGWYEIIKSITLGKNGGNTI